MRLVAVALAAGLTGCVEPQRTNLSAAQLQRCQFEARRATIYQGGLLGAFQQLEMQQMCERTIGMENREAVMQRLELNDGHTGTPILRARLGGMAETCGMAPSLLAAYRLKQGELAESEWQAGRRLARGAPAQECITARASVTALTGP